MKRKPKTIRLMLASAIALATLVTTAVPVAQAQGEPPPAATPIPLTEGSSEAPKVEPTAAPTTEPVSPQATDAIIWTPESGSLSINASGQTSVRVANTSGTFDPNSAKFVLIISGVPQADQNIVGQPVSGNNAVLDLVATGLNGVNTSNTRILFKVNISGGGTQESAIFNLTRNSRLSVPVINRDAGVTTIPQNITQTENDACNAVSTGRGGPLGSFLRYNVSNTRAESWFFANNPTPGASIVVSLTNYTNVAGQLQLVIPGDGSCGSRTIAGFATNPNPVVVVNNVPGGRILFRVVSGDGVSVPSAYTIGWAINRGGGTGGSGSEIEPNNNTCQATPLPERAVFTANDNDQFDFYSITITQSGQILLLMENHNTVGTQVQVRAPVRYNGVAEADCQSTIPAGLRKDPYVEPIGNVTSVGARVLSRAGGLVFPGGVDGDTAGVLATPQTWFIRVATPNAGGQSNKQYTLRWVFLPPGVSAYPFMDKMTQTGPARGSDPLLRAGDPFDTTAREKWYYSFFWANMDKIGGGAADTIQFGIDSFQLNGCPNAQFPPDPGRTVPAGFGGNWVTVSNQPAGVMTWKMNKSGSYRIRFRALRAGAVVNSDEKPLRVDCGFTIYNFGGLWPLSNDTATPGSPLIGPEKPFDWVEPIP
jgi:hypothetical protein